MMLRESNVIYSAGTCLENLTEYWYVRLHIPSGMESKDRVGCFNHNDFIELLAIWNKRGKDLWKYWEM